MLEWRCYEVQIELSEKGGSHQESNHAGHLACAASAQSATKLQQPDNHQLQYEARVLSI